MLVGLCVKMLGVRWQELCKMIVLEMLILEPIKIIVLISKYQYRSYKVDMRFLYRCFYV